MHFLDLVVYTILAVSQDGPSNNQQSLNFLPVFFKCQNSTFIERLEVKELPAFAKGFVRFVINGKECELLLINLLFSFIPF